jgi:ADP-ribose pyrophosphatase YjhB (NUDIX family)
MSGVPCGVHKLLASVALVADGGVLLVKYQGMPDHQRGWFLPHVLMNHAEHPDAAAERVLSEQLGLDVTATHGFIESFVGNDRSWHLVFHSVCRLPEVPRPTPDETVGELRWFPLDALPSRSEVAHHGWALDVLDRLGVARNPVAAG